MKQTNAGFDRAWIIILAYLGGIAGAELITVLGNAVAGMICYAILLFAIFGSSALDLRQRYQKTHLALALVPLIRIISLGMPVERFNYVYQYLIVSVPLALAVLVIIRVLDLRPSEVGLKLGTTLVQCLVGLTGIGFGLAEYYVLKPQPLMASLTWQGVLPAAIVFLAVGFVVELTFRGVVQHCLSETMGEAGWVCGAILFAVLQIGYQSVANCLFVLLVGLFFGWTVRKTGSLLGVTLSSALINIVLFIIIPNLVSR